MSLFARHDGKPINSWSQTDASWTEVQGWSANAELTMRCCDVRARATRSRLGLRHFAHSRINPTCQGGKESAEHEFLKAEALRTAHLLGFDAIEEDDRGDARPDVLIKDRLTGREIAIEIQLSRQNGYKTKIRTETRARLGMDTVWFFEKKRDYDDVPPTKRLVLPLHLPEGDVKTVQADFVRDALTEYLTGELRFDDFSDLAEVPCSLVGYDFPCGACGSSWFRTSYVTLYPNLVRGDFPPFAIPISKLPNPVATLAAFGEKRGRAVGRLAGEHLLCPRCGTAPELEFLTTDVAVRAPLDGRMSKHDMRWLPSSSRMTPQWRRRAPTYAEDREPPDTWAASIDGYIEEIQRQRRASEERRRLEEEHRRQAAERAIAERNAIDAETDLIRRFLAPHIGVETAKAWLAVSLPALELWTPEAVIRRHVELSGTLPPERPSGALELARRMLDSKDPLKGIGCGFAPKDIRRIWRSVAAARRSAEPSHGAASLLQRTWRALFG